MALSQKMQRTLQKVLEEILYRAKEKVLEFLPDYDNRGDINSYPIIKLTPLKRDMEIIIDSPTHGKLHIPQYWAVYVNDGWGPFTAGKQAGEDGYFATGLVWFPSPEQDPRLVNGEMPQRYSETKHLSWEVWKYYFDKNSDAYFSGLSPVIYWAPYLPGRSGLHFFDNSGAFRGFAEEVSKALSPIVRESILDEFKDILHIKDTATAVLGF